MPDFSEIFQKSKSNSIIYKDKTLVLTDKFPIENEESLLLSIEKTNSDCRQGLCVNITGYCQQEGVIFKQGKGIRMLFWEDTTLKPVTLKIFSKVGFVHIYNIWEDISHMGIKSVDYWHHGAAMIVEETENGRRYRCNDWHPDENFDDIIFTVQKIKQ